jgi:hypothetical protein
MSFVITVIMVGFNALIPALSLAASKSEIDRSVNQSLTTLYKGADAVL